MKIAFCSAVSFGTLGSPGTYKFVEKCREYFDIIVFAPLNKKNTVFKDSAIPVIPIKSLQSKEYIDTIIHGLHAFDPDIVYIFNYPSWPGLLGFLKKEFPDKKFILDLKSPLLAEGKKREEIQKNGMPAQDNLDAIVTLAKENVPTWIPDCSLDPFVYPLGIDLSLFHAPSAMDRAHCLKFVYIGVIHEKRQLDLLIGIFHTFVTRKSTNACLDIYGAGPDQERLQEKISSLSHGNQIRLCGLVPQKELIQKLADYDAGIAWVPYEEYDTSPSLKAIEYMAAGLPIMASDTTAHRLLEKQGCSIDFFGNNESALLNGLVNISANGFSNERIKQNLDAVKVCDYHHIIQHYFEPFFKKLIKKKTAPDTEPIPSKSQPLLYVGPSAFRPGIWETRAAYILPDLFNAVPDQFQIHLLTAPVPEFAKESLENLCQRYDIQHHEAGEKPDHISAYEYWRTEILSVSRQINPCALTNIFGPVTLGAAMGFAGRETFARIILRVAGDEIDSRISMGIYGKTIERLDVDTAHQAMGFQLADTIIAMSPLEKERICKDLPQNQWDKVIVSIRGIDISRFAGTCKNYLSEPVQNFLYVGRKSLEKGYDILEAVADLTFEQNPNIRFTFAGSFEPEKTKNRDYIGWVDSKDLSKTFAQTDAYIMTSRSEGFPQVAAEAMATGLPCILPEHLFRNLLTHEKEALLSDLDPQRISELIFRLHEDGKLADSLSKEAREFARTRLDKKIWEKIYHDILLGREAQIRQPFGFIGAADKPSSDSIVETGRDRQLKILFLVSPSMLAMGRTRHRLNRILMEMAERNHIIYLAYPHTASPKFIACQNIIHLIYTSETVAKEQIQQIAPDVVMLSSKNTERLVFYTLVQKMNIPVVFLDFFYSVLYDGDPKFPSTLDHAVVAFEEEIALSCGTMILTDQEKYFQRFTPSVGKKVSLYPNMVADGAASSEPAIENRTMNPKTIFFSKEKITVAEWEKQKKIAFDHIEEEILTAAGQTGNHENPERVEGLKLILDSLKEMDGKNKKLERELALLKNSYGFRIGQTFVDAISKPGKNTILFPWRFIKLAVSYLFKR